MATEHDLSDDYVSELLKQDAKASSIKYSALGLQAFLPRRTAGAALKPNTRFLRNILRETDSHNAALRRKERYETTVRIDVIENSDVRRRAEHKRPHDDGREHRLSSCGDSVSTYKRRRRSEHTESESDHAQRRRSRHRSETTQRHFLRRDNMEHRSRRRDRSEDRRSEPDIDEDCQSRSRKPSGLYESESHDTRRQRTRNHATADIAHRKSEPRLASNSRSPDSPEQGTRRAAMRMSRYPARSPSTDTKSTAQRQLRSLDRRSPAIQARSDIPADTDSDPLEAIVGPPLPSSQAPSVRSRGRGVFTPSSTVMDTHFSASYDPSADVRLGSDSDDDWDQALEALRDRQKWKQQGAERLRLAGFTEHEVQKWEKGDAKNESDVRWAKRGEGRDWDRGKVVGEDGDVSLKPTWGILRDS